jgi:predicted  nucleic acid-binding Zn-ribbon protein
MEGELDQVHKRNTQLELNITELKLKLKATDNEMHKETQRVREAGGRLSALHENG